MEKKLTKIKNKKVYLGNIGVRFFTISEEGNQNFDNETEEMGEDFIRDGNHKFIPIVRTNYNELQQEKNLIINKETKALMATFKRKAPGEDQITKYHLQNLPKNMLTDPLTY